MRIAPAGRVQLTTSMSALTRSSCHKHRYLLVLLGALVAASFAACRSTPATPAPTVSADTWAVVDGREITRDEVEKAYRQARNTEQTLSDEEALTAKLSLLNDLIAQDILLAKARELKIEVTDS